VKFIRVDSSLLKAGSVSIEYKRGNREDGVTRVCSGVASGHNEAILARVKAPRILSARDE